MYVIGGYDGQARLNAVECLDLSAEEPTWRSVAPMSQRRGLAGVTVYKGEINSFYVGFLKKTHCVCNWINSFALMEMQLKKR